MNTPRDFLDSAGTLQNHRVFDSFGRLVSETNAAATAEFSFFFSGGYRDPLTALDLRWHRWYDSQVGRWLSEDWIEDDLQNSYRYVGNSVLGFVDSSGFCGAGVFPKDYVQLMQNDEYAAGVRAAGRDTYVIVPPLFLALGTGGTGAVVSELADSAVEAAIGVPIPVSPGDLLQDGTKSLLRKGAKGLAEGAVEKGLKEGGEAALEKGGKEALEGTAESLAKKANDAVKAAPRGILEGLKEIPWGKYMPNGCEEIAKKIQSAIGGTIHTIKPVRGRMLGPRGGKPTDWFDHQVVVKDGIVYDALTGPNGLPITEFKKLWEYADDIDFGF